jgi:hypothetical protein
VSNSGFLLAEPELSVSRVRTSRENEKAEIVREQVSDFLFHSSTVPVAKELLFLERFTCFQQGGARIYTILATRRSLAVELDRKSKHHFA